MVRIFQATELAVLTNACWRQPKIDHFAVFEHFTHVVGVAKILRFEHDLKHFPEYIATQERGSGFAEFVKSLSYNWNF